MEENFSKLIRNNWDIEDKKTGLYSPLVLAYLGDDVYDLVVRSILVEMTNEPVNRLHRKAASLVKASAQAEFFHRVEGMLTEEETAVYKRGRNAKSNTMAKNASQGDYLKATGFEAVLGYLYLNDRMDRVLELVKKGIELTGLAL